MRTVSVLSQGQLHVIFAHLQIEFFDDDLGVNQTQKIDDQKQLPVIQMNSMFTRQTFVAAQ